MAITVNVDTYISTSDSDEYINDKLLADSDELKDKWLNLDYEDKKIYLKTAAEEIDSLKFVGIKAEADQMMAFPRKYILHEDDEVPEAIKLAQALEALELACPTSDTAMADAYAGNVRSYSLGSVSENLKTVNSYGIKAVIKSVRAQRLLAPYLGGGYRVR